MSAYDQHARPSRAAPRHDVGDRQQLGDVDEPGVGPAAQPRDAAADRLAERAGDVPAVERQQRDEVEHAEEQVQPGEQQQQEDDLLAERRRRASRGDLAGDPAGADDADRAVRVALLERRRSPRPTPQTFTGSVPSALTVSQVPSPIVRDDVDRRPGARSG